MEYPRLKMIEIYGGKNPEWEGCHNLCVAKSENIEDVNCVAGPLDTDISTDLLAIIDRETTLTQRIAELEAGLKEVIRIGSFAPKDDAIVKVATQALNQGEEK